MASSKEQAAALTAAQVEQKTLETRVLETQPGEPKPVEPKPGRERASLEVLVREKSTGSVIENANIFLFADNGKLSIEGDDLVRWPPPPEPVGSGYTKANGKLSFTNLAPGKYCLYYAHPAKVKVFLLELKAKANKYEMVIDYEVQMDWRWQDARGRSESVPRLGGALDLKFGYHFSDSVELRSMQADLAPLAGERLRFGTRLLQAGKKAFGFEFSIPSLQRGTGNVGGQGETLVADKKLLPSFAKFVVSREIEIMTNCLEDGGTVNVRIGRTDSPVTDDVALWASIRASTEALSFDSYDEFIARVISSETSGNKTPTGTPAPRSQSEYQDQLFAELRQVRQVSRLSGDAYRVLRAATEAFVMVNAGIEPAAMRELDSDIQEYIDRQGISGDLTLGNYSDYLSSDPSRSNSNVTMLPYLAMIRRKLPDVDLIDLQPHKNALGYQIAQQKMRYPLMLELIWSYWQEEGMLVQSMNAITRRFQNVRSPSGNDPLANLETDPLRPLNNLLWGYLQDEQNRLTVVRRNYEYDHHYGLRLEGKAVQNFRPADSRSKFLEAFHHLLRMCSQFFKQDDDTTVKADAFPVLNALKEVHLILSQGAHNQFGDLPSVARVEMLMQQWLLARPEFREFLPTRIMVAYPEPWMDRVDAMKKLQGWSDTSVLHFRSLATFGEQVLLSVRFGAWSDVYEPMQAFNWARFWRPQIQGYIHAYRAATGVDLTGTAVDTVVDATMPSVLLQRRLDQQLRTA